jgi:site-specific DNA recombinase
MTRRLHVAPEPVLRDGVYVRVSAVMGRADERFLSPDIQQESIDRARGRGPASTVVKVWQDIDVSTARVTLDKRPGLQAALAAAREHRIDRLWFLVLDRFDRDTGALRVFDEIAALGVELWTENGRIDIETPEGYLSTTMQLAIARYQRDRIGKSWKQTHLHRIERGLSHSGKARFGYVYDKAQRMHVPDPETGAVLADLFRRYVAGETVYGLVRWLNDHGITTTENGPWSDRTLRRVLDSGFASGLLTFNNTPYPGAHEPVIDAELWDQYCAARDLRRRSTNTERSQYLLSGLVRCSCGSSMTAGQYGARREPKYRCKAAKEQGRHAGGYVMAHYVEGAVVAWLEDIAADVDAAIDLNLAAASKASRRKDDASQLERDIATLDDQLVKLTVDLASGVVPEPAYLAARDVIAGKRDAAAERLALTQRQAAAPKSDRPQAAAAALLRDWDLLPVPQRREALRRLLARVVVTPGRPHGRIDIVPAWD